MSISNFLLLYESLSFSPTLRCMVRDRSRSQSRDTSRQSTRSRRSSSHPWLDWCQSNWSTDTPSRTINPEPPPLKTGHQSIKPLDDPKQDHPHLLQDPPPPCKNSHTYHPVDNVKWTSSFMAHIVNHDTEFINNSIRWCVLSSISPSIHHNDTDVEIDDAPLLHCHLNDNASPTPGSPISQQMTHNSMPTIQEIDDSQPKFKITTL